MLNVNKIFPRLPIRLKLVIAFGFLVTIPLVVTGAFGTRETLSYIERSARSSLHRDLEAVSGRTEHFLSTMEEDLVYLAETVLRPAIETADGTDRREAVHAFLRLKPAFYQVRLLTDEGEPLLVARRTGSIVDDVEPASGGAFYAYRARTLEPGQRALLSVEVRSGNGDGVNAVPAIAILAPLHDGSGQLEAIAVGEVYAARLFKAIEADPPQLGGTTGLVDAEGQYLYHSRRKRDWNTLLATRPEANLAADFGNDAARQILAGTAGTLKVAGQGLISFRPLELDGPDGRPLYIYRAVPESVIVGPARRFLRVVGAGGSLVLLVAMALAFLAATQFTRPIHRLRTAAKRLAAGEFDEVPRIETNDEIEDLASDFADMAGRLREHRLRLEELVAERTGALREAHAELAEILSHTDAAILRLDANGSVRVWNRGAERMFGWSAKEALGRPLRGLVDLAPSARGNDSFETEEDGVPDRRAVCRRADGSFLDVSLSRTVIRNDGGEPVGETVIIRDETRQRALEYQMLRSERLAAAGRLAAGVVHEINNPIGIIVNRIDCLDLELEESGTNYPVRSDLAVIRRQAERVGAVARRLLTLAREESETRQTLDLNELVSGVIAFVAPELPKRDLILEPNLATDLPAIVASLHGIETVLLNLLLNALDATPAGGVINVTTRTQGRGVEFEVSDTGPGMSSDVLEHAFEPFFTTKVKPRGTGLGLTVCQGVVQAHGGEIRTWSEPGQGSRFTVWLPIAGEGTTP